MSTSFLILKNKQLLRFSALGIGALYGIYRYNNLCNYVSKRTERRKIEKEIELANEARILYRAAMDKKLSDAAARDGNYLKESVRV